jgi:small subunit ribosomal protein S17e
MGRIKTKRIKRMTVKLLKNHPEAFKEDFTENKAMVAQYAAVSSKKLKNTIAGYATRLVRAKKTTDA